MCFYGLLPSETKEASRQQWSVPIYFIPIFKTCFVYLGFIRCAESIPVLIGVPLTAFLNDSSHRYGRAGYFICSAVTSISAILMFFIGYPAGGRQNMSKYSANGSIMSHCTVPTTDCPDLLNRSFSSARYNNWYSNSGTHCTSLSNGCSSLHHRGNYTPAHHQYQTNRYCHSNHCINRVPVENGYGRLHKSLSFAFQTPMMWNEGYCNYRNAPSYATIGRSHTRYVCNKRYKEKSKTFR